jgi:hypothetical protein
MKQFFIYLSLLSFSFSFFSCKDELIPYETNECKKQPSFIKNIGFNPLASAFSTSEKKVKGLALVQFATTNDTSGRRVYQHPSWSTVGSLGPLLLNANGECFVAPVPVINLIDNPPKKQNTLYKVDPASGELKEFINLPLKDSIASTNPYGILALAYLCKAGILYVSSVQGSDRSNEKGVIYAINSEGSIVDKLDNIDAFGLGVIYQQDKIKLIYGSARTSDIYAIGLNKAGKFIGNSNKVATIESLGPRGDDKARKIRFGKTGEMLISGLEFNFNLTAPTEKQENLYTFYWNEETNTWVNNK